MRLDCRCNCDAADSRWGHVALTEFSEIHSTRFDSIQFLFDPIRFDILLRNSNPVRSDSTEFTRNHIRFDPIRSNRMNSIRIIRQFDSVSGSASNILAVTQRIIEDNDKRCLSLFWRKHYNKALVKGELCFVLPPSYEYPPEAHANIIAHCWINLFRFFLDVTGARDIDGFIPLHTFVLDPSFSSLDLQASNITIFYLFIRFSNSFIT
jgi:hypothetical protein